MISAWDSPHNKQRFEFNFMIINFSIERYSIILINEGKSYGIKPHRFEKVAVEPIHFIDLTKGSAENIWLGVMKERPRCARSVGHDPEPSIFSILPYYSINKSTVFRFCR